MEAPKQKINKSKDKSITLIGKCGKCGKSFEAEAVLPLIRYFDMEGNSYKDLVAPHFVVNCPFCFSLLNFALRTQTKKRLR